MIRLPSVLGGPWGYGLLFAPLTDANVDKALNDPGSVQFKVFQRAQTDPAPLWARWNSQHAALLLLLHRARPGNIDGGGIDDPSSAMRKEN